VAIRPGAVAVARAGTTTSEAGSVSAGANGGVPGLSVSVPPELVEAIAQRAAEIVLEQRGEPFDAAAGFLDVAGAAEFLACEPGRIYSLVSARRIPHHRDGTRLLFDRDELREYVQSGGARRP
jgi:excisionase family DNA binding protein